MIKKGTNNNLIIGSELNNLLPQRFPFLFLDSIIDYKRDKWITGSKNIATREPMLLPESQSLWPEAFAIESMGQLAIALFNLGNENNPPPKILLGRISNVEFLGDIPLGCQMLIHVNVDMYIKNDSFIVSGYVNVNNERKVTMGNMVAKVVMASEVKQ